MSEPPLPSARRQLLLAKYGPIGITPFYFGFATHVLAPESFSRLDYFVGLIYDLTIQIEFSVRNSTHPLPIHSGLVRMLVLEFIYIIPNI